MSSLENFSPDQQAMLVALPYRVGLWVSASDTSGGGDADEAEMRVLQSIVTGFAEDFLKSAFVQDLMEQTTARRAEWASWENDLDSVPTECSNAVDFLAERIDRKELTSFKLSVMEIATDVAMAYREEGADRAERVNTLPPALQTLISTVRDALLGPKSPQKEQMLNISKAEREALNLLSYALDIGNSRTQPNERARSAG